MPRWLDNQARLDPNAKVEPMRTARRPLARRRPHKRQCSPASEWTAAQMNQLLWDAGVLTLAGVCGFRKAACDEFRRMGYRLATIRKEREPQNYIFHLSMYALNQAY